MSVFCGVSVVRLFDLLCLCFAYGLVVWCVLLYLWSELSSNSCVVFLDFGVGGFMLWMLWYVGFDCCFYFVVLMMVCFCGVVLVGLGLCYDF